MAKGWLAMAFIVVMLLLVLFGAVSVSIEYSRVADLLNEFGCAYIYPGMPYIIVNYTNETDRCEPCICPYGTTTTVIR